MDITKCAMGGIRTDCGWKRRWGDDVVEGEDIELEFQRWEQCRRSKNEKPPTNQAIPQHQRVKWSSSLHTKVVQGKATPLLTKEEWGCMAEDIAWGDYKRAPTQVVWMWMFQKKLMEGANRSSRLVECRC